jgi:molybdate transport system substrate-binding protein
MPETPRHHAGLLLVLAAAALLASRPAAAADLLVFAAASLQTALDAAAAQWNPRPEADVTISYAASSALARQIEQGAPADVFISANVEWMDLLEDEGLIDPASRRDLLGNRLVLIAHGAGAPAVELGPGLDLAALLGDGRLAMALVDAVPAGIYGRAALTSLGLWEAVAERVAQTDNVRAALALVARGEAPYGIVYATDAAAEPGVTVVASFPEASHPPIVYPAATTAGAAGDAAAFLDFLASDAARPAFAAQGFTFPDR